MTILNQPLTDAVKEEIKAGLQLRLLFGNRKQSSWLPQEAMDWMEEFRLSLIYLRKYFLVMNN